MFTEAQLTSFGNFLFKTYDVQVYSNDGKSIPIHLRQVTDADFCNWKDENLKVPDVLSTPSKYQIGDNAVFSKTETFGGITFRIIAVHFFSGKVKYDLILYADGKQSRIYNVDS